MVQKRERVARRRSDEPITKIRLLRILGDRGPAPAAEIYAAHRDAILDAFFAGEPARANLAARVVARFEYDDIVLRGDALRHVDRVEAETRRLEAERERRADERHARSVAACRAEQEADG